jgi:hypothetical protein
VNTAVVVYDLERIRNNEIFQTQVQKEAFGQLAAKYHMTGSLGKNQILHFLHFLHSHHALHSIQLMYISILNMYVP